MRYLFIFLFLTFFYVSCYCQDTTVINSMELTVRVHPDTLKNKGIVLEFNNEKRFVTVLLDSSYVFTGAAIFIYNDVGVREFFDCDLSTITYISLNSKPLGRYKLYLLTSVGTLTKTICIE